MPHLKLTKGKKCPKLKLKDDLAEKSYKQGKEDAKKIDVRRKRITANEAS